MQSIELGKKAKRIQEMAGAGDSADAVAQVEATLLLAEAVTDLETAFRDYAEFFLTALRR